MFDIESSALRRMIQQVTPHMDDPDNYMPILSSVRFEARDGWLYALATDRYTFAASRREIVHTGDITAHVPGPAVPTLTAWLDEVAEHAGRVGIAFLDVRDDAGAIVFTAAGHGQLQVEYEDHVSAKFPDWRKLFHSALTAESGIVPASGVTTKFLARWAHAADKLVIWQEAPRKPIVFLDLLGQFAGMQMPITADVASRDELAPQWISATKPRATVDGVTYDLDVTWEDRDGDPWTYSGNDTPDGMALMVVDGIADDAHPLDRLIQQYGPLSAA